MTAAKKIILALCLVLLGLAYAPAAVALDAPGNRTWEKIGVSPQTPLAENSQVPGTHQTNGLTAYDPASGCSLAAEGEVQFAQQGISATFRNGEFAGQSISDVAQGLRSGAISSSQLPLNVVVREGVSYTLNNRSLMALRLGGVQPTVINNVTGNAFFESQLTLRLGEIGSSAGPTFVPVIRGGP